MMIELFEVLGAIIAIAISIIALGVLSSRFRIVVPTNDVHIVQHASRTLTFGKDQDGGNVYYHWPAWIPHYGVRVTTLPSSVFPLKLADYPAYDKGRVPFQLDVLGFFRVTNFSTASSRVSNMEDLHSQLDGILKGAMRAILASSEIEDILEGRSQFGERFTQEVDQQLTQWGVVTVKAIELMDIRDAEGSKVISNIMAKKASLIERQSRVEVANNRQIAEVAEIEAKQTVEVRAREQEEIVGKRSAERDQVIGIRQQQSDQAIAEEQAKTAQQEMIVKRISVVRDAEINREAQVVTADAARQRLVIEAEAAKQINIVNGEGDKQNAILVAEGTLESQRRIAEARRLNGEAEGIAQQAVLMAPVNSQIALAKEIGENQGYQTYLLRLKEIEAGQTVGTEAAKALEHAGVKIIATTGAPMDGIKSVMDLMTPKGATQIGAALESFANTPLGEQIVSRISGNGIDPLHK
jgi:flotillin